MTPEIDRLFSALMPTPVEQRVIKTDFANPPIPDRSSDWCAWYDDIGEEGPRGWGRTEAEAISDLKAQ